MYFASNCRYLRNVNGLSQEKFALIVGSNRSNIGAYEEGRCEPPFTVLDNIASKFSITHFDLMKTDLTKELIGNIKMDGAMKKSEADILFLQFINQPLNVKEAIKKLLEL